MADYNHLSLKDIIPEMKFLIDIQDDKTSLAEEFFKNITFVKKIRAILPNEITNTGILTSIENYEQGSIQPTPLSLSELNAMICA